VTDVLAPGDFLVFRQELKKAKPTTAEALRLKTRRKNKKQQDIHAL